MCKCCQYCLESCYWHLIEKRFCYDDDIALYEVPEKEEKNNNMFDNMAFYDSVSVIAGRAIVTIDPLPEEKPIVQQPQPTRRLRWEELRNNKAYLSRSVPIIYQPSSDVTIEVIEEKEEISPTISNSEGSVDDIDKGSNQEKLIAKELDALRPENLDPEIRRKSLRERRMSKSLYLKIDQPKELPIIRQMSMPKFYLDTPEEHQQAVTSMFRTPSTALASPVPSNSRGLTYDLYSVVQMERERVQNLGTPLVHKDSRSSRLLQIKEKIKLRRVKSSLGTPALPHSHQHI